MVQEIERADNDCRVAELHLGRPRQDGTETIPLYSDSLLKYGRGDHMPQQHDQGYSRDHLEFYVVTFDENHPPLCYVRDRTSRNGIRVNGQHIGDLDRITSGHCLFDGDIITVPGQPSCDINISEFIPCLTFHFRQDHVSLYTPSPIQQREMHFFADRFTVTDRTLGSGAHARVFLALEVATRKQVVCKIMDVDRLRLRADGATTLRRWKQEIDMIRQLHHPNIISYVHAIYSSHTLYFFTELATGGDLFSLVQRRELYGPPFREGDLKLIMKQIVDGVDCLHKAGVVHRDLKPENVLLVTRPSPEYRIALSDLGHSAIKGPKRLMSRVGTERYIAPEMISKTTEHASPVDMWAMGVIMLFIMDSQATEDLGGLYRYNQEQIDECVKYITNGWHATLSAAGAKFLQRCLMVDPSRRITSAQAKMHPWFAMEVHARRLSGLKYSIKRSWNANKRVFPCPEEIPDLNTIDLEESREVNGIQTPKVARAEVVGRQTWGSPQPVPTNPSSRFQSPGIMRAVTKPLKTVSQFFVDHLEVNTDSGLLHRNDDNPVQHQEGSTEPIPSIIFTDSQGEVEEMESKRLKRKKRTLHQDVDDDHLVVVQPVKKSRRPRSPPDTTVKQRARLRDNLYGIETEEE